METIKTKVDKEAIAAIKTIKETAIKTNAIVIKDGKSLEERLS